MGDLSTENTLGGAAAEVAWTLAPGDEVGGYRVVRRLGRGGMGEVYLAEHEVLGKSFALKLVSPILSGQAGFLDRFKREARVAANLEHPHIVRVDDFGSDAGRGLHWLRMEYVEGVDAAELVGASGRAVSLDDLWRLAPAGRLPEALVGRVLLQVLDALAYAHGRGVVHRDLKPANVLLDVRDGGPVAKVSDFGLVKVVGEEWLRSMAELSVSRAGQPSRPGPRGLSVDGTLAPADAGSSTRSLVGTYEYMAPEQKRGEAGPASDCYAMGLIAYRLLTGRHELGMRRASELVPGLDAKWDAFLLKALEEDPKGRFADAGEMLAALRGPAAAPLRRKGTALDELTRRVSSRPAPAKEAERAPPGPARFCTSCGVGIAEEGRFCQSCGSEFAPAPESRATAPEKEQGAGGPPPAGVPLWCDSCGAQVVEPGAHCQACGGNLV